MRVAINGFGRIGRSVFRILNSKKNVSVVAINDIADNDAMAYLLKYDTVMGPFKDSVSLEGDIMKTSKNQIKMVAERDPSLLPWKEMAVDVVIEATGIFREKSQLQQHINAGAKRVILTVPSKDEIDYTLVIGVNDDGLNKDHKIISNASCTTNCLAPMAKILNDSFEIEYGVINTIHAYTNDQRLADVPHSDWRRSRAAAENIIPTTTGAARAVGKVLPELNGKLDGFAIRVPTINVSLVDLCINIKKESSLDDINSILKEASKNDLSGILGYNSEPLVSIDFNHSAYSSVYDESLSRVMDNKFFKICSWYDNEWGFSNRMLDVAKILANT